MIELSLQIGFLIFMLLAGAVLADGSKALEPDNTANPFRNKHLSLLPWYIITSMIVIPMVFANSGLGRGLYVTLAFSLPFVGFYFSNQWIKSNKIALNRQTTTALIAVLFATSVSAVEVAFSFELLKQPGAAIAIELPIARLVCWLVLLVLAYRHFVFAPGLYLTLAGLVSLLPLIHGAQLEHIAPILLKVAVWAYILQMVVNISPSRERRSNSITEVSNNSSDLP